MKGAPPRRLRLRSRTNRAGDAVSNFASLHCAIRCVCRDMSTVGLDRCTKRRRARTGLPLRSEGCRKLPSKETTSVVAQAPRKKRRASTTRIVRGRRERNAEGAPRAVAKCSSSNSPPPNVARRTAVGSRGKKNIEKRSHYGWAASRRFWTLRTSKGYCRKHMGIRRAPGYLSFS